MGVFLRVLADALMENVGSGCQTPASTGGGASMQVDFDLPDGGAPTVLPQPPAHIRKQRKRGGELLHLDQQDSELTTDLSAVLYAEVGTPVDSTL